MTAPAPLTAADLARTLKLVQSLGWLLRREGRDNTADECDVVVAILKRASSTDLRALLLEAADHAELASGDPYENQADPDLAARLRAAAG